LNQKKVTFIQSWFRRVSVKFPSCPFPFPDSFLFEFEKSDFNSDQILYKKQ
jgi:hypothetical protein